MIPAVNMLGTSRSLIGCMIWQHAVIVESICETNSIRIFVPAQRTGLHTSLLTYSPCIFFSPLLGQFYSKSNFPFSSFFFDNLFIFQFLFPLCFSWTKNSKSNSKFHKNIPRQFCFLQFHSNSTKKFQVQLSF